MAYDGKNLKVTILRPTFIIEADGCLGKVDIVSEVSTGQGCQAAERCIVVTCLADTFVHIYGVHLSLALRVQQIF